MIRRGWVTAFSQISMPPIRFQQERGPYLNYFTAQLYPRGGIEWKGVVQSVNCNKQTSN